MSVAICDSCEMERDNAGRELTAHGTTAFPATCFDTFAGRAWILPHWHEDLEMLVVTEGACIVELGAKRFSVKTGQGFFINAGVLHSMPRCSDAYARFRSIVFHPRLVAGGSESAFSLKYVEPVIRSPQLTHVWLNCKEPWHQGPNDLIRTAWEACAAEEPGYELEVRESLSRAIMAIAQRAPHEEPAGARIGKMRREDSRIKKMMRYVHENYASELSVGDLARQAAVSESECLRCFRGTIGTTPMQYVKEYRLQKAAALLRETGLPLGEIGALCGYTDPGYFSKCFRAWSGQTPTDYRRAAGTC